MNKPIESLTDEELFCLEGCRSYPQYHKMRAGFESGHCEFCNLDRTLNTVLWEEEDVVCWAVPSQFLRNELLHHFIIIPKRHVRFPWELVPDEVTSMQWARMILSRKYELRGGIMATRFGDMNLNAGTVPHLHENIMVPNGTGEVRVPVFKDPSDRAENQVRAAQFAKRYEAGDQP
jgi:diadenosine tetraphosphate (Ap4A) HIT family hydrolase